MNKKLNILIIEDSAEDAVINVQYLNKAGYDIHYQRVETGDEMKVALKRRHWDLILSDYSMPDFDVLSALAIYHESSVDIPFIVISGAIGEEKAVGLIKSGAHDYFLKNNMTRFASAVERELREAATRKELNLANAAVTRAEKKYQNYIKNAPDGVFVADETGKYLEVNEAACKMTGYSKDELLKMLISDILPDESLEEGLAHFRKVQEPGVSKADFLFKHKNGTKRWWSVDAVKLDETRFLGFTKDITQRKEMEENLRAYQIELKMQNDELNLAIIKAEVASEKYSELYDFAPSGYFTLSNEGKIIELNLSGAKMLGKERLRLIDSKFSYFISKNTQPVFNTFFLNVFQSYTIERCEVIIQTVNNHPKYVLIEGIVVGNRQQCLINVIDITDRKQAEEEMRESEQAMKVSEEKYKTILNASPDGILLIDMNGLITEVSEIGLELFGADTKNDLVGKNFLRFVPSGEKNTVKEIIEKTILEGLAQNIELKIRKRNLSLFLSEISSTLIQGPDGAPLSFMIIIRDISQRKKMETKLIHADRMANLGEMASGIAHEINQPLNIISMVMDKILFESAKTETVDTEFLNKKSDKIFENITRIRNIIDHIRAFSRSHDDWVLAAFDINSSIENAASMIAEQFKHLGINLNLQLEKQMPQIVGNTYKFEQVILNLLVNAKDAVIEKKSKQDEPFEMNLGIRSYQENHLIIIEITDTGIGIAYDDINNIMLPFYTTKDAGKGTGLGLSICYQIIKEMDGTIEITSNSSNGTKIKLVLDILK